jgi:glutathione S-transferase
VRDFALYYTPGACSLASHITIEECGIPYRSVYVDIRGGENGTADYLAINALGKVPTLTEDGRPLTETVAILHFLAKCFPEQNLLPADPYLEALCLAQLGWLTSIVHPVRRQSHLPQRYAATPLAHDSIRETGKVRFWECCRHIDADLTGRTWSIGDHYSVCDPYLLLVYAWALSDGYPLDDLSSFTSFKDRMLERRAVRTVLQRENNLLAPLTRSE